MLANMSNSVRAQPVRFWDRIAKSYAKRPIADEAAYRKKLQVTRNYFRPDTQVLEFGCGTGSTAIIHAPHVKHIRATDISSKMIAIAQAKADAANISNVTFEQATLEQLDVPDESLDVVLGLSILHLLPDKEDAIARVFAMLKPGGVFVSSTACLGDSQNWFRYIAPVGRFLRLLPLVKFFKRTELEHSLVSAGFELDYAWQPGKGKGVFIVAKKPA